MPARAEWEIAGFFGLWLLVTLAALAGAQRRAWRRALGLTAGLYGAVVAADLALVDHRWAGLMAGEARFVVFDATLLLLAALFAYASAKVARYAPRSGRDAPSGRHRARHRPGSRWPRPPYGGAERGVKARPTRSDIIPQLGIYD